MIKWLFIGLIIWYYYNRFTKKRSLRTQKNNERYIREDEFTPPRARQESQPMVDEDDYIDYEEIK